MHLELALVEVVGMQHPSSSVKGTGSVRGVESGGVASESVLLHLAGGGGGTGTSVCAGVCGYVPTTPHHSHSARG